MLQVLFKEKDVVFYLVVNVLLLKYTPTIAEYYSQITTLEIRGS